MSVQKLSETKIKKSDTYKRYLQKISSICQIKTKWQEFDAGHYEGEGTQKCGKVEELLDQSSLKGLAAWKGF